MIKVITSPHTGFAAKILVSKLVNMGYEAISCDSIDVQDKSTYIIYNSFTIRHLPKNYIVMQTEVADSRWFTRHYLNVIANAKAVWEYSSDNISCYQNYNKKIAIVTPGIEQQVCPKKDIDFLFYGWVEGSERRAYLLRELSKLINIRLVTNKLGSSMWYTLSRTKVVINLHYYDRSPLELYRINEALSFGCHVVSEPPASKRYSGIVNFSETAQSIALSAYNLKNAPFRPNLESLSNKSEIERAISMFGI